MALTFSQLAALAWLSGGCVVVDKSWYPYWATYQQNDHRPYVWAEVKFDHVQKGVPYGFEYYGYRKPLGITLEYSSRNVVTNPHLRFESVTIQFSDGSTTNLTAAFQAFELEEEPSLWGGSPCLYGTLTVEGCLPTSSPFTIYIKGALRSGQGVVEEFDASMSCTSKEKTRIMHKFQWLAKMNI